MMTSRTANISREAFGRILERCKTPDKLARALGITLVDEKKCKRCKKVFLPIKSNQKFCSRECNNRDRMKRYREAQRNIAKAAR